MGTETREVGPRVVVRRCVRSDVPRIVKVLVEAREAAQWSTGGMEEVLANHGRYFLVADVGEEAAGFVSGRGMGEEAEILNLAVRPANRRQGIATTLIGELLKILKAEGTETVFLEVRESNAGAISFYRRMGFEEAGRRDGYYQRPEEAAMVMRAKLRRIDVRDVSKE